MKQLFTCCSFLLLPLASLFSQTYNMTNTVITTCSGNFYDNGGSASNYSINQNLTQTFTAPTAGYRLKVFFSDFATEAGFDSLSIYDGATATASNFMSKNSGAIIPLAHYSTNQSLTFRFVSDNATTNAGWTASVSCFGISSISPVTSSQSQTVNITVNGSNTSFLSGISAVYLKHAVTGNTISPSSAPSLTSNILLSAPYTIPCNADPGMYNLCVEQPSVGITMLLNAFNVTPFQLSTTPTNISCNGMNNGMITTMVTGGTPIYSYLHSPLSITTANATNLAAGIYTTSVTDVLGCTRSQTTTITQPPMLTNVNSGNLTVCQGQSSNLFVTPSGGVPPYSYNWTPVASLSNGTVSNPIANPAATTTYTFSVVDANGCGTGGSLNITVYPLPMVVVSPTNVSLCAGSVTTLSVSGADTYNWNTGATTTSITVSPSSNTVYTVTGVSSMGCAVVKTATVTVNPLPVAAASIVNPVCIGGNLTFNNTSTGASIYSWSGPSSYASTVASPVITNLTSGQAGTYTLSVISAASCANSTTIAVTVNALPTLTLNANPSSICAGKTTTVNATGAFTYTWMPGSLNGAVQTFTPTSSTVYSISGTNAAGCVGNNTVGLTVNALTAISGTATVASAAVSGSVTLYEYKPFLTQFDSITTQTLNGAGSYNFNAVPSGSYIVKAIPAANTLQITYGGSAVSWQNADVIPHGCIAPSTRNITVQPFASIGTGPGSMSGTIQQGSGFGQRPSSPYSPLAPGQPIGGIVVKGGKNPGGSMFTQTTTGTNGTYTLSGLPTNAPGESYFILVDIPGLDTNHTYHKIIDLGNSQYTGLDFIVDSVKINPVPNAVGIKETNNTIHELIIFPNPASNSLHISFNLNQKSPVQMEVIDLIGKTTLLEERNFDTGKNIHSFDITKLNIGIYFLKVKANEEVKTIKFLKHID